MGIEANSEMLDNLLQFMERLLWGWESRPLLLHQLFEPLMSLALLHVSFYCAEKYSQRRMFCEN